MTTVAIPEWFPDLIVYALCTGLLLGLLHEAFWPGKNVKNELPVWATQIFGVSIIWAGFAAFCGFKLGTWAPPAILGVFIVFGGLFPLALRFIRWSSEKLHKLWFFEKKEAHE